MLEDIDRLMEEAEIDAIVSEGNAFEVPDIFWLTGFLSPDSVIYLKNRGEGALVATMYHTLERVKKEGRIKKTHSLDNVYEELISEGKRGIDAPDRLYSDILKKNFSGDVIGVPDHLPARVVLALQELGYKLKSVPTLLKDARATKSDDEIKTIEMAGDATVGAISYVLDMIKNADIGANKVLTRDGNPLTVYDIKNALDHYLLDLQAESAEDAIVAVGEKGFDWHYLGKPADKLKAGVPIIIDVFPRLKHERYVADVTRTIVRGDVSDNLQKMFDAVKEAADASADALGVGVTMDDVNMACYKTLEKHGFDSRRLNPSATEGMTHGLGHGIGLEVHENPSFYRYEDLLEEGHVLAVEPGVYLEGIGGVRIENDYAVTKGKAKRLTTGLEDILFV